MRPHRWLRPLIEFGGFASIVLAGVLLFEVGTAWGFLAFVPATLAAGYVMVEDSNEFREYDT